MKIKVLSDLHLEFGDLDPGTGDVLVLAGDICVASELDNNDQYSDRYLNFFDKCVAGYNKVFYTLGNHEHYDGDIQETLSTLERHLPSSISILQNQSELYDGVHFVGSTLWTDFDNANPMTMLTCQEGMSDYHVITNNRVPLTTKDTLRLHDESVAWLTQAIPTLRGKVIVFTHHAPSRQSFAPRYRSSQFKGAYCTDLSHLIEINPNIEMWVHGHIHSSVNYKVGETMIVSNPRGYDPHELNPNFNTNIEYEVSSDKEFLPV